MAAHLTLVADNVTGPIATDHPAGDRHPEPPNVWVPPPPLRPRTRLVDRLRRAMSWPARVLNGDAAARRMNDRGAVTAEYAVVILAAVAFAGLLVAIMRSGEIRQMLVELVQNALGAAG